MPTPRRKKARSKDKQITARSITLVDAKGKARIFLDAGDGDGFVTICLFGQNDRSIQISISPEGGLHISLKGVQSAATFGLTSDENAGLSIKDKEGRLGTLLGAIPGSSEHRLLLCRDGQPYWSTPKTLKQKKPLKKR